MIKFLFVLIFVPSMAHALLPKGGGGGIGIVCYEDQKISSVELLDLYEARAKGLKLIPELKGSFEENVTTITEKIYKRTDVTQKVLEFYKRYHFIPEDSELELTNDAFPAFLPRGCELKQIANFYNDSTIWVDSVLYKKLSLRDRVALLLHEYIYSVERESWVADSRYTRTIIGHALSVDDPFNAFSWSGTHVCATQDQSTVFTAKRKASIYNVWEFDFQKLNGHEIFSRKKGEFEIKGTSPLGNFDSSHFDYISVNSTGALESKINPNEVMNVTSESHRISLSWTGFDPGDEIDYAQFECYDFYVRN